MTRRRKPYTGAINARLPRELARTLRVWVAAHQDDYKYWGRKPGLEQFAGAVLLDFLKHATPQQQAAILARSLAALEALERADNEEDNGTGQGAQPEPPPTLPVTSVSAKNTRAQPKARRKGVS